jgi:two-component system, cell cycle response regulator
MKVMIAEDDRTSRFLLRSFLQKWGYDVVVAEDGDQAWKMLQEADAPRLAVLDWMMPGVDGPELCRRVRSSEGPEADYTYLILLTAKTEKASIVAGMEAGADDYIVKPFDAHELQVRVRAGERIVQLHQDLLELKEQLQIQATTDPLTGIANRRALLARMEIEMARARRSRHPFTVSMLDLDHFKQVNDAHGHAAGDLVLREFAGRVRAVLRDYDTVGRVGGEEFVVLVPNLSQKAADAVFERIRLTVKEPPFDCDGVPVTVTVSQGLVTWDGEAGVDELLLLADSALYAAKAKGRDRVERA